MTNRILEKLIRDLLTDAEILDEKLVAPEFDFGFICLYPPVTKSHKISLYKPKNGNYLIMVIRFQISEKRISVLRDSQGFEAFNEIKKFLLMKVGPEQVPHIFKNQVDIILSSKHYLVQELIE